jgi:hypothetical protein
MALVDPTLPGLQERMRAARFVMLRPLGVGSVVLED